MKYNQMIDQLHSLFPNGEHGRFILTDPDCMQVCRERRTSDGTLFGYYFMQMTEFPPNDEMVSFEFTSIQTDAYSADDLWRHGESFYESREEFETLPDHIKFECVFESTAEMNVVPCHVAKAQFEEFLRIDE